jgi:hypothetical protein
MNTSRYSRREMEGKQGGESKAKENHGIQGGKFTPVFVYVFSGFRCGVQSGKHHSHQ